MTNKKNDRYTAEFKSRTIQRMMPPKNEGVRQLSEELGIPEATLYAWRKKARMQGSA